MEYYYSKFHDKLRYHLYNLFNLILEERYIKKIDLGKELLGYDAMYVWGLAMTPKIYDIEENYERLEMIGDSVMDTAFLEYMIEHYPQLSESDLTDLTHSILSKEYQWKMTIALELDKHVRLRYAGQYYNNYILTDICEAFFGAAKKVGDMMYLGFGGILARQIMNYIFSLNIIKIDLDNENYGADKTQVQQVFTRFGLGKPEEELIGGDGSPVRVTIKLTDKQLEFLQNNNINIRSPVLANMIPGGTRDAAKGKAYEIARITLAKYGVTADWASDLKIMKELANVNQQLYYETLRRSMQEGYPEIYFDFPKKLTDAKKMTCLLIGIRSDGRHVNLQDAVVNAPPEKKKKKETEANAKNEAMQKYVTFGTYPPYDE